MGFGYGLNALETVGRSVQLLANSTGVRWRVGGATIDWSTIAANNTGSAIMWDDGVTVAVGAKALRFGQCMCRITAAEVITVAFVGTPTSGSYIVWGLNPRNNVGNNYSLPYNATVAQFQTAMDYIFGAGGTVVAGTNGGPYTVSTAGALAGVTLQPLMFDVTNDGGNGGVGGQGAGAGLNAGVTITATVTAGSNSGMWGPYDNTATDGRQTITRGNFGWVNESVLEQDSVSNYMGLLEGGVFWKDRMIANTSAGSLTAGPLFSVIEPLSPFIQYAQN